MNQEKVTYQNFKWSDMKDGTKNYNSESREYN